MRILLMVHDMMVPNRGGGAPRTEAAAKAFMRMGHEVFVMAPVGVSRGDAEKEIPGCVVIPTRNVDRIAQRKMLKHALYSPVLAARTALEVKRHKIDMIFVHDSVYGAAALVASKLTRKPFVFDATDLISEYVKARCGKSLLFRILSFGERRVMQGAKKTITVSKTMKSVLEKNGAKRVEVVYDGVDFSVFHKCPQKHKKRGFTFIYQGGMDPQDGLEILVQAAERVVKEIPDAQFWVVGDGSVLPSMKKDANERGLSGNFMFTGWIPFKDVKQYISDADAGLVILPDILSARIRVTLKTFEYWACGKPIIVSRLDALEEVVDKDTGLFYRAGDFNSLADMMIELARNGRLRKRLTERGAEAVKRFEWAALGDDIARRCLRD